MFLVKFLRAVNVKHGENHVQIKENINSICREDILTLFLDIKNKKP